MSLQKLNELSKNASGEYAAFLNTLQGHIMSGRSICDILTHWGHCSVGVYEPAENPDIAEVLIEELRAHAGGGIAIGGLIQQDFDAQGLSEKYGLPITMTDDANHADGFDFVVVVPGCKELISYDEKRRLEDLYGEKLFFLKGLVNLRDMCDVFFRTFASVGAKHKSNVCILLAPTIPDFKNWTLDDNAPKKFSSEFFRTNPDYFKRLYSDIDEYSDDYIGEIFAERAVVDRGGYNAHADCRGKYVNIIDGKRLTVGNPSCCDYGIVFYGGCFQYGIGTDDRHSMPSVLQEKINEWAGTEHGYTAVNCGVWGMGAFFSAIQAYILKNSAERNRIHVSHITTASSYLFGKNPKIREYMRYRLKMYGIYCIDLYETFERLEEEHGIYIDLDHVNHRGYRAAAERIFEEFVKPILEEVEKKRRQKRTQADKHFVPSALLLRELADAGVHVCLALYPGAREIGLPSFDSLAASEDYSINQAVNNLAYYAVMYGLPTDIAKSCLGEIMREAKVSVVGGELLNSDVKGNFVNVQHGRRVTCEQPEKFGGQVFIFGGSAAFGLGCDDSGTIASLLQEQLNGYCEKNPNATRYKIVNEGLGKHDLNDNDIAGKIRASLGEIKPGDVVIWLMRQSNSITGADGKIFPHLSESLTEHGVDIIDLSQSIRLAQKSGCVYIDNRHFNPKGSKAIATKIYFDYMKNILSGAQTTAAKPTARITPAAVSDERFTGEQNKEFSKYLDYLSERKREGGTAGAIVMNCNPFTLGHRYLAERAAKEVDFLYVFVVEEDKSLFSFEDRFRLVSEGLRDLCNVLVLPSGKFIISTITFPGYFSKDAPSEIAVDTSLDIDLFAKYIAPTLNISARFAGSEPIDMVTRAYNRAMAEAFPRHGVRFVEFERAELDGEPISASRVRTLLEEKNFDEIKRFVPETTYRYLLSSLR
ncbi:hypothetical protein FACS1894216_04170 [Synergistales bacterium]|nr:hypothetical protein FACS1894216_04170 [Synergistales bacterium]